MHCSRIESLFQDVSYFWSNEVLVKFVPVI